MAHKYSTRINLTFRSTISAIWRILLTERCKNNFARALITVPIGIVKPSRAALKRADNAKSNPLTPYLDVAIGGSSNVMEQFFPYAAEETQR
jgi:hypothetical protein